MSFCHHCCIFIMLKARLENCLLTRSGTRLPKPFSGVSSLRWRWILSGPFWLNSKFIAHLHLNALHESHMFFLFLLSINIGVLEYCLSSLLHTEAADDIWMILVTYGKQIWTTCLTYQRKSKIWYWRRIYDCCHMATEWASKETEGPHTAEQQDIMPIRSLSSYLERLLP